MCSMPLSSSFERSPISHFAPHVATGAHRIAKTSAIR